MNFPLLCRKVFIGELKIEHWENTKAMNIELQKLEQVDIIQ
jgi:hypothetical protein